MVDEKKLIMATRPFTKEDRVKSWRYLLTTITVLTLCYVGIFMDIHIAVSAVLSVLAGLTIVRLFIIYHDYVHKTILQKSWLANVIFTFFGLYILAAKSIWQRSHDYHHKHNSKLYTSSIGSFPVVTKERFLAADKKERNIYLFMRHPLTIILGYFTAFTFGMTIRSFLNSPDKHWDSLIALIVHFGVAAVIIIFAGWETYLFASLIPSLISSGMGSYLFYAQHNFPSVTFEDKDGWTYVGAAMKSSSYMKMNPVMRWFTGNIGYHHIHHINSQIPFYRLPEAYAAVPELHGKDVKTTSLKPMEIIRCFRLKVWDPEQGKMIGLKEVYKSKSATLNNTKRKHQLVS